jgi:hypothetical protein
MRSRGYERMLRMASSRNIELALDYILYVLNYIILDLEYHGKQNDETNIPRNCVHIKSRQGAVPCRRTYHSTNLASLVFVNSLRDTCTSPSLIRSMKSV